jgi:hypothetical protein
MQSNHGERYLGMNAIAAPARRRKGMGARFTAAMTGGAGLVVLVLLFLASFAYVVFGGAFAESSAVEVETQIAAVAAEPAGVGDAAHDKKVSSAYAEAPVYSPPTPVSGGHDGDGNVMTYEHD